MYVARHSWTQDEEELEQMCSPPYSRYSPELNPAVRGEPLPGAIGQEDVQLKSNSPTM